MIAATVLTVAVAANTLIFTIVNGVLLKPLAYRESHRLVSLREIWKEFADRAPTLEVNERHFNYWREHATSFDALAQYIVRSANLTGRGEAAQIAVAHSSGTLFDVAIPQVRRQLVTPSPTEVAPPPDGRICEIP